MREDDYIQRGNIIDEGSAIPKKKHIRKDSDICKLIAAIGITATYGNPQN